MPTLVSVIGEINHGDLDPLLKNLKIQCHQATLYWLVKARLNRPPSVDEFVESGNIIRKLMRFGAPLSRPAGPLTTTAGSVLVFTGCADGHSCITRSTTELAGYNQADWLPGGKLSQYTTHKLSDIRWISQTEVRGNKDGSKCTLTRINEVSALGNLELVLAEAARSKAH